MRDDVQLSASERVTLEDCAPSAAGVLLPSAGRGKRTVYKIDHSYVAENHVACSGGTSIFLRPSWTGIGLRLRSLAPGYIDKPATELPEAEDFGTDLMGSLRKACAAKSLIPWTYRSLVKDKFRPPT